MDLGLKRRSERRGQQLASCIYEGTVRHRRRSPRHEFTYRLALAYLDLDELPSLLEGRLVRQRPGLLRFRRSDYLGNPDVPLSDTVRKLVAERTGRAPSGPIRVLTQLRSYGHCFNPVSFYYCFDEAGERIEAIVAEVTNTPWHERHAYVVGAGSAEPAGLVTAGEFDKALHVSPFLGMQQRYRLRAATPGRALSLHVDAETTGRGDVAGGHRGAERHEFDATLSLRRRELTRAEAARLAWRYPLATVSVLARIYSQALRLKLAGAPYHPRPQAGRA
jgi:DUF1365 family protein